MKKVYMNLRRVLLFSLLVLIISSAKSITAKAAVTATYDKVVELNLISSKSTGRAETLEVKMDAPDVHIANVKTSSKYLKAGVSFWEKEYGTYYNWENISMYATKKGRYNLTFDIVDSSGNVLSSESAKVIVCTLRSSFSAYKSIKIGNTNVLKNCLKDKYTSKEVTLKKSGKIKIWMNKGYKLKNIQVKRYIKSAQVHDYVYTSVNVDMITENITNGSKVNLSTVGSQSNYYLRKGSQSYYYNDSIYAYTYLTLTYTDKKGVERQNEITLKSKIK